MSENKEPLDLAAIEDNLIEVLVSDPEYKSPQHKMLDNQRLLIAEVKRLRGEIVSLKREVNEYEGKDWRSDRPVYPEVE